MPHKILIVDDDEINTALVKFGLASQRYEVLTAADGQQGLNHLKGGPVDLIILDVHMPTMNGFEFMTELKNIQGFTTSPVIMLTASETLEDVFKLEGVRGYFVKPVKMPDLIETIKTLLGPNPL